MKPHNKAIIEDLGLKTLEDFGKAIDKNEHLLFKATGDKDDVPLMKFAVVQAVHSAMWEMMPDDVRAKMEKEIEEVSNSIRKRIVELTEKELARIEEMRRESIEAFDFSELFGNVIKKTN